MKYTGVALLSSGFPGLYPLYIMENSLASCRKSNFSFGQCLFYSAIQWEQLWKRLKEIFLRHLSQHCVVNIIMQITDHKVCVCKLSYWAHANV